MKNPFKPRALADIPNTVDFILMLIPKTGPKIFARVVKGEDGCHFLQDVCARRISLPDFIGWEPLEKHPLFT